MDGPHDTTDFVTCPATTGDAKCSSCLELYRQSPMIKNKVADLYASGLYRQLSVPFHW